MKKHSKKFLVPVLSLFAIGLSVGVGFAAWTIVGQDATQTVSGNTITAEGITDKRVTLTAKDAPVQSISFSSKADKNVTNPWLARDDKATEDLDFKFSFTLASKDKKTNLSNLVSEIKYKISVNDNAKGGWAKAVTAGYVSGNLSFTAPSDALPALGTENTLHTSLDTSSVDIDISGSFVWGTHFGGKNPYTYYNSNKADDTLKNSSTTYADDASASLSALATDLNGVSFTLTVLATPKTA